MKDEILSNRSETKTQGDCRIRGRPQLRWEDRVKRDLRKAEEEEKWRAKANKGRDGENNERSRTLSGVATDQPHPYKWETRGRFLGHIISLYMANTSRTHTRTQARTHAHT